MRILIIAPHAHYIERGSPIDVDNLVRALSARGDSVDLVVYSEGEDRHYPGVIIHRAQYPSWLGRIRPGFSLRKVLADLWLFAKAGKLVAQHHYDIVHAGEEAVFAAMWFRWRRRLPYVYDMDSSIAQQMVEQMRWLKPLAPFFDWCESRAIRNALATAPVCNALAVLARRQGARHVTTLHDISLLNPDDFVVRESIRDRLGLKNLVLVYAGNLESYQGIDLLLEAFSRALADEPGLDLVIAGGTPRHITRYEKLADRLGASKRTHFIGHWPVARLGELLAQADILVAPRIRGINTPMKIFPYLHSGRAVLVTDLPTHTQILDATYCELAPPEPDGFAAGIIRLARDEKLRRRLGAAGERFVEANHRFSAHQRRVDDLYKHIEHCLRTAS